MSDFWKNEWNPDQVEDSIRNPLPEGKYTVVITDSEIRENKSGTGEHIALTMQVIDEGPHQNRLVWAHLNVVNRNPQAERIGRAELKALCTAIDVIKPDDASELRDKPFVIKVKIDPKDSDRNVVRGYMPAKGTDTPKPASKPAAKPESPAPAETKAAPPWKRK